MFAAPLPTIMIGKKGMQSPSKDGLSTSQFLLLLSFLVAMCYGLKT